MDRSALTHSRCVPSLGCLPTVSTIPSQYLDGPEIDCDLVMSDGVPVYGAITDNWPTVGERLCGAGARRLLELAAAPLPAAGPRTAWGSVLRRGPVEQCA
jgi:hypothetical protein